MHDYTLIGTPGPINPKTSTQASSALHAPGHCLQMLRFDPYFYCLFLFVFIRLAVFLASLIVSAALGGLGHWGWAIAAALPMAWAVWSFPSLMSVKFYGQFFRTLRGHRNAYRSGCLIPGVVVSASPLRVACGAVLNYDDHPAGRIMGIRIIDAPNLPHTSGEPGDTIPCVATFQHDRQGLGYWNGFTPRPVAWGHSDPLMTKHAVAAVEASDEWKSLKRLAESAAALNPTDQQVVVFDGEDRQLAVLDIARLS